jgi:hypothetical protein
MRLKSKRMEQNMGSTGDSTLTRVATTAVLLLFLLLIAVASDAIWSRCSRGFKSEIPTVFAPTPGFFVRQK